MVNSINTIREAFDRWKGALVDQVKQTTRAARHRAHARVKSSSSRAGMSCRSLDQICAQAFGVRAPPAQHGDHSGSTGEPVTGGKSPSPTIR